MSGVSSRIPFELLNNNSKGETRKDLTGGRSLSRGVMKEKEKRLDQKI